MLKKNKNVPDWLKKGVGSSGGALTAGRVAAPKDRILSFVDSFVAAFKAGNWDITTAKSKIVVGKAAIGARSSPPTSARTSASAST